MNSIRTSPVPPRQAEAKGYNKSPVKTLIAAVLTVVAVIAFAG
ncbi:MAG: hypothetical protein ABFC24_11360 [Methanoregulaceae archaeon]